MTKDKSFDAEWDHNSRTEDAKSIIINCIVYALRQKELVQSEQQSDQDQQIKKWSDLFTLFNNERRQIALGDDAAIERTLTEHRPWWQKLIPSPLEQEKRLSDLGKTASGIDGKDD